jgi:hypothetical protein
MSSYSNERPGQRIEELPTVPLDPEVSRVLRRVLLKLADEQEAAAADEAAHVPYWKPCPHSVIGIRVAARALREAAEAVR